MKKLIELTLPYAGVAGLGLLVFYLLFREVIRKKIYPQLTNKQAYKTLRNILILVWLIAMAGIIAWVYRDIRLKQLSIAAPIPPTAYAGNDDLRLVDVSFQETPTGQNVLDLKLRNVGNAPAFIKRALVTIKDSYEFEWLAHFSQQEVTWTGNICLPRDTQVSLSQSIKGGDTDRIQFQFFSCGRGDIYSEFIYELEITFIYNENDKTITTNPITLYIPRQADVLAATGLPEDIWKQKMTANAQALKKFLSRPTIQDPKLLEIVEKYKEAGF